MEALITGYCEGWILSDDIVTIISRFISRFSDMPLDLYLYSGRSVVHMASQKEYLFSRYQFPGRFQCHCAINACSIPPYIQKRIPTEYGGRSAMMVQLNQQNRQNQQNLDESLRLSSSLSRLSVFEFSGDGRCITHHVDLPPFPSIIGQDPAASLPLIYNPRYEKLFAINIAALTSRTRVYALDFKQDTEDPEPSELSWTLEYNTLCFARYNTSLCSVDKVSIYTIYLLYMMSHFGQIMYRSV